MPAKKKSTQRKRSRAKPAAPAALPLYRRPYYPLIPVLIAAAAVFLTVCFIWHGASDKVGGFGTWVCNGLYGLFSLSAWAIPLLLLNTVWGMRRNLEARVLKWKLLAELIFFLLLGAFIFLLAGGTAGKTAGELWDAGTALSGGGVVSGSLAGALLHLLGAVGAYIIAVLGLLISGLLMLGMTPLHAWDMMILGVEDLILHIGDWRARHREDTARLRQLASDNGEGYIVDGEDYPEPQAPAEMPADAPRPNGAKFDLDVKLDGDRRLAVNPYAHTPSDLGAEKPPDSDMGRVEFEVGATKKKSVSSVLDGVELHGEALREIFGDAVDGDAEIKPADKPLPSEGELDVERKRLFDDGKPAEPEYKFPPMSFLKQETNRRNVDIKAELDQTAEKLVSTLESFGVKTRILNVSRGPTVTRYELQPDSGVKVRQIVNLVDDISLNLASSGVRIEAPIPGKAAVGIEVPNRTGRIVYLREILEDPQFAQSKSKVSVGLGMDVAGQAVFMDIAKMPHLLIAGATGMGKSICINVIIHSLLYKARPDEVKLILIDPKKVEFSRYKGIPHLLVPVVSEPKKAAGSLAWAVGEMERRFTLLEEYNCRDNISFNELAAKNPELEPMPLIVIIIDELADLMMTAPDDVENSICRLAQKARAAGMHLIIGTQRPSVDVITGLIKANVPSRIAFTVASPVDSRVIIDVGGAEKLIGRGDMLFAPVGCVKPTRVQGAFISEGEMDQVCGFIKKQTTGEYDQAVIDKIEQEAALCGLKEKDKLAMLAGNGESGEDGGLDGDEMLRPAIELAIENGRLSTTMLQSRLSLGYARAARIIDKLEQMHVIGPFEGSKPRKVLINRQQYMEMNMNKAE